MRRVWTVGLLVALLLSLAGIAAAAPGPTAGSPDLKPMLLDEAAVSQSLGFRQTKDRALDIAQVLGATRVDEQRLGDNVRQGHDRYFESERNEFELHIRLIEFSNHYWADRMRAAGNRAPGPAFPADTHLIAGTEDGRPTVIASSVMGRIEVIVYIAANSAAVADESRQEDIVATTLIAQLAAIPVLPDLTSTTRVDVTDLRIGLIVLQIVLIPLLGAGMATAATLRDRGSLERILRTRPEPESAGRSPVHDLSSAAARLRRRGRIRVGSQLLIAMVLSVVELVLHIWASAPALLGLAIAPGIVAVVVVMDLLIAARRPDPLPFQRTSIVPAAIGIVGSLAIIYAANFFLFAAIAVVVLTRSAGYWVMAAVLVLVGWRILTRTSGPYRFAKRLAGSSIAAAQRDDHKPRVFVLRSFQDDALTLRMRRTIRHNPIELASTQPYERFEELLAWSMWQFGPVWTVGRPGTNLAPLGAAREYHRDDNWQLAVESEIRFARIIVFVVGRSPALMWEVATARRCRALSKCLFVFPPLSGTELHARLVVLAAALDMSPDYFTHPAATGRYLLGMYIGDDGRPVLLTGDGRDDSAYQTLFSAAGNILVQRDSLHLSAVATDLRAPRPADVSAQLVRYDPQRLPPGPPDAKANLRYILDSLYWRLRSRTGETGGAETVVAARAAIYRYIQQDRYGAIYDWHLAPRSRKAVPRWSWIEQNRAHNAGRDFSGPEHVIATVRHGTATALITAHDGTPTPPQRFVNVRGRWLIEAH
ncbi:hypothetical protein [Nocardia aurantia]|uniref:Uncharacterized protein n=1 Tax=Nocardia aurantia TaxID=2585199 RepID=A0A7K0DPT5_9NOCA|nr:hypothetical protein [Nocardia aurantia]MQY27392.1 hypothetical protein [Nocardia aurantia]